jgi:arginyl-tRNA synthetase
MLKSSMIRRPESGYGNGLTTTRSTTVKIETFAAMATLYVDYMIYALQLAKGAGMPPRDLATALAERLGQVSGVKAVDIAGPGFLNITLDAASAGELARTIVEAGAAYGRNESEAGHVINLEFISANPTGPLMCPAPPPG